MKVFSPEAFATNTNRLRGVYSLGSKILKTYGKVVEVDYYAWKELMDNEKIPFLMQKVNKQIENLDSDEIDGIF